MQLTKEQLQTIFKAKRQKKSIVPVQVKGDRIPIFAVPGLTFYQPLSLALGDNQPFYGFEASEHVKSSDKASQFVRELLEVRPEGPYILAAYCAHYRVVLEIADQLIKQNKEIPIILFFESYGPTALSKKTFRYVYRRTVSLIVEMKESGSGKFVPTINKYYRKLKKKKDPNEIRLNGVYLADDPIPEYNGRVALFRSSWPLEHSTSDPNMGWESILNGTTSFHTIKGNHMGIFRAPKVSGLADSLKPILDQLQNN